MRVLLKIISTIAFSFSLLSFCALAQSDDFLALDMESVQLHKSGNTAEAIFVSKRALALAERQRGVDHIEVAGIMNNLIKFYDSQRRWDEAEILYERIIKIYEKQFGPNDPRTANALNAFGVWHSKQSRDPEAEPLFQRAITIFENVQGQAQAHIATPLNNLASVYRRQDRFREAEQLYLRSISILESSLGPEDPKLAATLNNLAFLYAAQGRDEAAEPLFKRSLVIAEKALGLGSAEVGYSLQDLGNLYRREKRLNEAENALTRALAIFEAMRGPNHIDTASALARLGDLRLDQGRLSDAEELYKRSVSISEKIDPNGWTHAGTLNDLVRLLLRTEQYSIAEPHLRRSMTIVEKRLGRNHSNYAALLTQLAMLSWKQGKLAEASSHFDLSLKIAETTLGSEHPSVARVLNNQARLALEQNDITAATRYWRRSVDIVQSRSMRGLTAGSAGNTSLSKDSVDATSTYSAGLVKVMHRLIGTDSMDAGELRSAMFEIAQLSLYSEAAKSLAQMAVRSNGGAAGLSVLIRERQDLGVEWQEKDKQFIAARGEPVAKRNTGNETVLAERLSAIDARLASIDALLAKDFPDYAALSSPKPISIADVQENLRDDEALVLFLDTNARFKPLPEETFTWIVTKTKLRSVWSEFGTAALHREVAALRCGLDATAWHEDGAKRCADLLKIPVSQVPKPGAVLPFDADRSHALYKSLFGGAEDLIKGKHLLVVPSGALTTLPFQVLVTDSPKSNDLASVRWLIRDHAITVLPSVASLVALRRTGKPSAAPKPMIGFANPLLDGIENHAQYGAWYKQQAERARAEKGCAATPKQRTAALRAITRSASPVPQVGGLADLAHLKMQTPLPETADEVCDVARSIGANVAEMRIGAKATEAEVKRLSGKGDLAKYRVLHFATHGLLAGQLSGTREPGLILTPPTKATPEDDGYLSGSEIAALKLDADWVILSACNTAGGAGEGEAAEALSGLGRMFFYAGARALLVSHWEVDSAAAVKLVTGAVGALSRKKSLGRAEVLRRAMLAVMADKTRPKSWVSASHPAVWAPFVVVGEGGAGR